MPQIQINSTNIETFSFDVTFNPFTKKVLFDIANTSYSDISGTGFLYVLGVCFSMVDSDGVELLTVDWSNPQILPQDAQTEYTLDLSGVGLPFFFQNYKIIGYIKDGDGVVYSTTAVRSKVCQPVGMTEGGYVNGQFQVSANCADNLLTIKELTLFINNNETPTKVVKDGTLYYPTGTISPVIFTGTPFTNNEIYTGGYRIHCETVATYDLGNGIFENITYLTDNEFPVTCANKMADLNCCLVELQQKYEKNCNNAQGLAAQQQIASVAFPLMIGLMKEINGQDASSDAAFIRKSLNCNCGISSIRQNEFTPINPAVTTLVLNGVGGTSIATPSINGNTKTYNVVSNVYQVVKGNTNDLAYSIIIDTSTTNTVKYKITFNYDVMAATLMTTIGSNDTLLSQLNSLITFSNFNIDLSNLNGSCVIDISAINYFLSFRVPSGAVIFKSVTINGTTYTPLSILNVSDDSGIETYLNGLGLGTFQAGYSSSPAGGYFNLLSAENANTANNVTLTIGGTDTVVDFQKTNKSLIAVLQAIIDYLCNLTSLQIALGDNLSLCYFDYNADVISQSYTPLQTQGLYNMGISQAICNIVARINSLTGLTCTKLQAIFSDSPSAVLTNSDRFLTVVGGSCVAASNKQVALAVIAAVNAYSDVKSAFCAIDCTIPSTCPDVSGLSLAMSGSNIGFYGLTWSVAPLATQQVTVRYKLSSSQIWIVATNNLLIYPNGGINGTSPFTILNPVEGATYQVWVSNNCGGVGFIGTITTPTGTVYTGQYLLENVLYDICGATPVTLYSSAPFGTGTFMFTNIGLTTPLTGFFYIADASVGEVYNISSISGEVMGTTGLNCSNGFAGQYALSNSTGTICSDPIVTLYTIAGFGIGVTIYLDAALSTPVSGYDYVYSVGNGNIYLLNDTTGQIGALQGNCNSGNVAIISNNSFGYQITGVSPNLAFSGVAFPINYTQSSNGTFTPFTGVVQIGIGGLGANAMAVLSVNSVPIETVFFNSATTISFASYTYNNGDLIEIEIDDNP